MRIRSKIPTSVAAVVVAASVVAAGAPEHRDLLLRLSRVAALYQDSALDFACKEAIAYKGVRSGSIRFSYLFTHGPDGRLHDYRTWPSGTTPAARGEEVDPRDYHVPRYLESAYLWAFVFRWDRQPLHAFYDLGDGEVLGRPAVKIGFQPKGPIETGLNDWIGVAWIDRETSQILEVEAWPPESWNQRAERTSDLESSSSRKKGWKSREYQIESIVTEFSVEKNGMRFPGKVTIVHTVSTVVAGDAEFPIHERETLRVTQEYSDYEFFAVRSKEEIGRIVSGDEPPPGL